MQKTIVGQKMIKRSKIICKICGKSFIWMINDKKRMVPVDYKTELDLLEDYDPKKMVNHWNTCEGKKK